MGRSNGEHRADGGRFDNWAESLIVVHSGALCETPDDPAILVAVKSPIRERLMREYPFAGDDIGVTRPKNKFPSPIAQQAPYSSSMATLQFGLASAARTEVEIGDDGIEVVVAVRMRGSRGIRKPALGACDHLVRIHRGSHGHCRDRSVRGRRQSRRCGCRRSRRLTWTMDVGDR
jgi:hypothetical protein